MYCCYEPYKPLVFNEMKEDLEWRIGADEMIAVELLWQSGTNGRIYRPFVPLIPPDNPCFWFYNFISCSNSSATVIVCCNTFFMELILFV